MENMYYEDELSDFHKEGEKEVEEDLEKKKRPTSVELEKPFLKISDLEKGNPRKELVLIEWLDFLFSKNDIEDLIHVLSYYVDLGWISEDSRSRLISYTRGFMENSERNLLSRIQVGDKEYEIDGGRKEENKQNLKPGKFTSRDHIKSLRYIMEIIKDKIPEETYQEILDRTEEQ